LEPLRKKAGPNKRIRENPFNDEAMEEGGPKHRNKEVGVTDANPDQVRDEKGRSIMRGRGLVGGALCMVTFILAIDRYAEERGQEAEEPTMVESTRGQEDESPKATKRTRSPEPEKSAVEGFFGKWFKSGCPTSTHPPVIELTRLGAEVSSDLPKEISFLNKEKAYLKAKTLVKFATLKPMPFGLYQTTSGRWLLTPASQIIDKNGMKGLVGYEMKREGRVLYIRVMGYLEEGSQFEDMKFEMGWQILNGQCFE
jgi:hypothetical protein